MIGSPLRILDIRPFKRAGMFFWRNERWVENAEFNVHFPHFSGAVTYSPELRVITLNVLGHGGPFYINVDKKQLRYGPSWFFVCDCCGIFRQQLVLSDDGCLLCLEEYRRRDSVFSQRHRNALILEAQHELERVADSRRLVTRSLPKPPAAAPQRAAISGRHASPPAPPADSAPLKNTAWKDRNFTTESACDRGHGIGDWELALDFRSKPPEEWLKVPTVERYSVPADRRHVVDFPLLDIRVLSTRIGWREGAVLAQTLQWDERPGGPHEVALFIDWRGADPALFVAHSWWDDDARWWQRLPLVMKDGRLRFICPVRGANCDMLYLRDGVFASREAQRLVHLSQTAEGRALKKRKGMT